MGNGVKVAIVAAGAIGDGAVALVLARNLAAAGFETSFYSKPFSQMKDWLPWAESVKPYPPKELCESEFSSFDLVLADSASILGPPHWSEADYPSLASKYLYLGLERVPKELCKDQRERLAKTLPPWKFALLERIASYSGDIRYQRGDRTISMAECARLVALDRWGLSEASSSAGLVPPPELNLRPCGAAKRVMLHPFSGLERKNWPLRKYLAFARWLRRSGWEPEFCCSAAERPLLLEAFGEEFPIPQVSGLSEFAARIYESYALVGNDSGPVHLASCLGVRTLTISLRGRMHRWRPGWRQGVVVLPPVKIKFSPAKVLWKPFTPVWHVKRAFRKLEELGERKPELPLYV